MDYTVKSTIGDVVATDYRAATVFNNHKIDFCCNGNKSIEEACQAKNIDANKVLDELNQTLSDNSQKSTDFNSWPLDLLADYIEKKHHKYCEAKISEIKPYIDKIKNVHGNRHPELAEIQELFGKTAGEMSMHMKKEELTLFPYIRKMVNAKDKGIELEKPRFGSVESPIEKMMNDHDEEGERFRRISKLTNDYTVPEDGCNTYKVTLAMLKEFEDDLHMHIHLENNILFPKSLELEKELA